MIIFVDDDLKKGKLDAEKYLLNKELNKEPKLELQTFHCIDDAWDYVQEQKPEDINLFITGIIMPPGKLLKDKYETYGNLRTGKVFVDLLRKDFLKVPIVVYTVVHKDTGLRDWAESLSNVTLLKKNQTTSLEFVAMIKNILLN